MKEIGGYLGLDNFVSNEYHHDLISLNTGANALLYLIKAKKIKKLYIPYYLCNSISDMLKKNKFDFDYYNISDEFYPIFDKEIDKDEYLYIVNYYGQLSDEKILFIKNKYNRIILDNTHAFFQKPIDGIDTIYSCRKFFGVPDGAYLSTNAILEEKLEEDKSSNRMKHILGRFEGQASEYYEEFRMNDETLKDLPLKKMSKLTKNILGAIDYCRVLETRNRNFKYLHDKLRATNVLNLMIPEGAFAYPYYVEDGIQVRKKLIDKKIYIPLLWPNVLKENDEISIEYNFAANILPLPCDQRYTIEDMSYLIEEVKNCLTKKTY